MSRAAAASGPDGRRRTGAGARRRRRSDRRGSGRRSAAPRPRRRSRPSAGPSPRRGRRAGRRGRGASRGWRISVTGSLMPSADEHPALVAPGDLGRRLGRARLLARAVGRVLAAARRLLVEQRLERLDPQAVELEREDVPARASARSRPAAGPRRRSRRRPGRGTLRRSRGCSWAGVNHRIRSPGGGLVVLHEAAEEVLAGLAEHDRVVDPRGPVDQVERRVPALGGDPQLLVVGRSSVIQPVSTAVIRILSVSNISPDDVRVSMLSAALAMLVCGWPAPL